MPLKTFSKGDFTCDKNSKEEFIISTTAYWKEKAPQYEINWYGINVTTDYYGDITDIYLTELGEESDQSRLDLVMSATKDGKTTYFIFELKERWNQYTSTYYGVEPVEGQKKTFHNEGWIFNIDKSSILKKASEKGFIPIYANLYPDGIIRIWNMNKVSRDSYGKVEKNIHRQTVIPDSEVILQSRYTLMNKDGITYKRYEAPKQ